MDTCIGHLRINYSEKNMKNIIDISIEDKYSLMLFSNENAM